MNLQLQRDIKSLHALSDRILKTAAEACSPNPQLPAATERARSAISHAIEALEAVEKLYPYEFFVYHNYLVFAFDDGCWEILCPNLYFRIVGNSADRLGAIAAAKSRIDEWFALRE